jgi:hypothetical protein
MKFIGLIKSNGEKVMVHLQYLIAIEEKKETDGCRVYLRDHHWVDVAESYQSISSAMNEHGVDY